MAKHLAEILVLSVQITGRAIVKAMRQEIEASRQAARARNGIAREVIANGDTVSSGLTLQEAMQILNTEKLDAEAVLRNYNHLFSINSKTRGGSLYLQSKIFRAKERIDNEILTNKYTLQ